MAFVAERRRRRRRRRHAPVAPPSTKTTTTAGRPPATKTTTPSTPAPAPYVPATGAPTELELLHLNRLGTGYTPDALSQLRTAGGPAAWLRAQLSPAQVAESAKVAEVDGWYPWLSKSPAEKWQDNISNVRMGWRYANDLANWTMMRQIYSRRMLQERMVAFWSDVLHVPAGQDHAWPYRFDYDAMLRRNALGRFEDLLVEASLHPAMRAYLDNYTSVKNAPNENQGRELLELHSVTPAAGYTEAMVKSSAVILSGYTLDWGKTFAATYDPNRHTTGPVTVLGFSHANANADGQAVTVAYLKYLANHPSTARTVARRMATAFVSDNPSGALVDRLAQVFTSSGTSIAAVLTELASSPEFAASTGQKVRTPVADLVATARVVGVDVHAPVDDSSYAFAANWQHGGIGLYSWPRPDGAPLGNAAWASPARMFNSFEMHYSHAGGWWPKDATFRSSGVAWLPAPMVMSDFVDLMSRALLGRPASPRHLAAVCQNTDTASTAVIDTKHRVVTWCFARLVATLLDSPEHMTT